MTRDDVIRIAREAGASFETAESMFRFAALVAAAERNRIARAALAATPGSSRDDQHAGGLKVLNHQGLMERARQNAKKEAGLIYPDDDARRKEKEQELASEYYRQYTTPNP